MDDNASAIFSMLVNLENGQGLRTVLGEVTAVYNNYLVMHMSPSDSENWEHSNVWEKLSIVQENSSVYFDETGKKHAKVSYLPIRNGTYTHFHDN